MGIHGNPLANSQSTEVFCTIWGCSLAMFGAASALQKHHRHLTIGVAFLLGLKLLFTAPEMGVSRNGGNPKWINGWFIYVPSLENPIKVKMDDLGLSLF
jgi:hypothetical protein